MFCTFDTLLQCGSVATLGDPTNAWKVDFNPFGLMAVGLMATYILCAASAGVYYFIQQRRTQ